MTDYRAEKSRILQTIREYERLKNMFLQFIESMRMVLPRNNEYRVSLVGSTETGITLKVFDKNVDILFSFVLLKENEMYGRLDCFFAADNDLKDQFLTAYFDRNGNFLANLTQDKSFVSLGNNYFGDYFLTLLLNKFITMPRFRIGEDDNDK